MGESAVGPLSESLLAIIPRDGPGSRLPNLSTISGYTKAQRLQEGGRCGQGPSVSQPHKLEMDFGLGWKVEAETQ